MCTCTLNSIVGEQPVQNLSLVMMCGHKLMGRDELKS